MIDDEWMRGWLDARDRAVEVIREYIDERPRSLKGDPPIPSDHIVAALRAVLKRVEDI